MYGTSGIGTGRKIKKLETIIFKLRTNLKLDDKEEARVQDIIERESK